MLTSTNPTPVYQLPLFSDEIQNFYVDPLAALRGARRPIHTMAVAIACDMDERTAFNYLRRLELVGLAHRPAGKRSGWMVVSRKGMVC